MATTPHSSLNLSNIGLTSALELRFKGTGVNSLEGSDFPGAQGECPLPDFNPFLNCNADQGGFDSMLFGDGGDAFGLRGGEEDAGRRFVEREDFGAKVRIDIDLR